VTRQPYDLGPCLSGPTFPVLREALKLAGPGVALEFGVGSGASTRIIAAERRVVGFDSFQGLPEDWRPGFPAGRFAQPTPPKIPNTSLVIGRFENTLPDIDFTEMGPISLVHIDCDLYSSTATALKHLEAVIQPGQLIVFDEWHGYSGCEEHEQRAWKEYVADSWIDWTVIGHGAEAWGIRLV
jgi:predicted O-methyltransferase YrrM